MISLLLKKTESLKATGKETTERFNNYYRNIVQTTSGKQFSSTCNPNSQGQYRAIVKKNSLARPIYEKRHTK